MSFDQNELYEFGDYRLDVGEHKIEPLRGSANGVLREKPFQTLVYLLRNSGRLVSKQELLSAVWPDAIVEEGNLGKAIHAIRSYLGERSGELVYIETIPKHGYRFIAHVRRVSEEPGEMSAPDSERDPPDKELAQEALPEPSQSVETADPHPIRNGKMRRSRFGAAAVAIAVVAALGAYLGGGSFFSDASSSTVSNSAPAANGSNRSHSPAYDLYVRGKVKVANENREDTEAAIRLLEQAVAIDPALAQAHAQLARAYNTMAFKFSSDAERKRYHENADVAIEKALELDPELAEAHFARGLILWSNTKGFPHEHAIRSYKRSLAIDPNSDETYHQLSLIYSHIGRLGDARSSVGRALELNPSNTLARFRDGVYLQYQGKFDEALAIFKTIPRDHTPLLIDRSLAETLIQVGRLDEAEAIANDYLARFPQDEGGSFTSVQALLLAKEGRADEAQRAISRANEIGSGYGHFHHTAYNIASAYAAMNRPADAVKWLENAADNGFPNYPYFAIDPNLDAIRENPDLVQFMAKLKIRWERLAAIP